MENNIPNKKYTIDSKCCGDGKIIINADDLGKDGKTNQAIRESFARGVISSTTIMANMPSFEDACEISHREGWSAHVGVHLNLSEGRPLTKPITSISSLCDENGNFRFRMKRFSIHPPSSTANALYVEMKAQIERVIKAGISPAHLDSHNHDHTIWAVATQVIALAKEYKISAVRLSANITPQRNQLKRFYKLFINNRLRHHSLSKTLYFGTTTDLEANLDRLKGYVEIEVHPSFNDQGYLIDRCDDKQRLLVPTIEKLNIGYRMCSYRDILNIR